MENDINIFENTEEIISIKQLLSESINIKYYDYINKLLLKNVKNNNLLFTFVCYLLKLFMLDDYENNTNKNYGYYFDESFIIFCFRLIRNKDKVELEMKNTDHNDLKKRLVDFYIKFNIKDNDDNKYVFEYPTDAGSITHITNALSRDIQTNIKNNIILNYLKYIKEYVRINLKNDFKDVKDDDKKKIIINEKYVNYVFNDLIHNTFNSNIIFHDWIKKHKPLLIPNFSTSKHHMQISSLDEGYKKYKLVFNKLIKTHIETDTSLEVLIHNNNAVKHPLNAILKDLKNNTLNSDVIYHDWIKQNIQIIINKFNSEKYINLEKELEIDPFIFLPFMIFINKNLELNKSKKKYQIIPLRTNLTPKFIPINVHALVDILDSEHLFGNIKNDFHNDTSKGIMLFSMYFNFSSNYIKNLIKRGYSFSGLIHTNGYEIIYIFETKKHKENKDKFHSNCRKEIKYNKELTKDLTDEDKDKLILKHKELKEKTQLEKETLYKQKYKDKQKQLKDDFKNKIKKIENELEKLTNEYKNNIKKLKDEHYENIDKCFKQIDVNDHERKTKMKDIIDEQKNITISKEAFLTHCYNMNYNSMINDIDNDITEKYNCITNLNDKIDTNIKITKSELVNNKKELKKIKNEIFTDLKNNIEYKQFCKEANTLNKLIIKTNANIKKIIRTLHKIELKTNEFDYECENKSLTDHHINNNKTFLIKYVNKIFNELNNNKIKSSDNEVKLIDGIYLKLNKYCDNFNTIKYLNALCNNDINMFENIIKTNTTEFIKKICKLIIISLMSDIKYIQCFNKENEIKLEGIKINIIKIKSKFNIKQDEKYKKQILKSIELSKKLNEYVVIKNKNEIKLKKLFKTKSDVYLKVDDMSKKYLEILDKMNWVVIDPGMNSIFTMLSKDGKTKYEYTKQLHINRTSRKKMLEKIERIKKEKITKLENSLCDDEKRGKTSNNYKDFKEYYNKKMKLHDELVKLYDCDKLNKLKWNQFINEKRSEKMLINDIKRKFGSNVVLILGDWSMNKSHIKSHSPTPNKKYTKILEKNILTLTINEFRSSQIHNQTNKKCENYIEKYEGKKTNIKSVFSLEKLRKTNEKKYKKKIEDKKIHKILFCKTKGELNENKIKYINRDYNATLNLINITKSIIKNNHRPETFVMGTKICESR